MLLYNQKSTRRQISEEFHLDMILRGVSNREWLSLFNEGDKTVKEKKLCRKHIK